MKKQKVNFLVKFSIFLFLIFLCNITSQAQSISIFDIDTTNFPIIKAKIYAVDQNGKQIKPTASELKLTENGENRKILNVICNNSKPVKAISSVLVMDVSGSMSSGGSAGIANIDLAKQASTSWINALPTASSQCAISSFDGSNYFIQDFTTDKSKLLSAINTLTPSGGTDYDAALYNPMAGGIPIAKSGKYKKVVIILTDGMPNQEPQVQSIINEAKNNDIMIFAVTLVMPCPDNLKEITTKTGGFWYENVTTVENARQVYFKIMKNFINIEPCDLTWESDFKCSNDLTNIEIKFEQNINKFSYQPPFNSIASLKVSPNSISFTNISNPNEYDTTINIKAINADFIINDIKLKYGTSIFSIKNQTLPITIAKNSSKNIILSCKPLDSFLNYAYFEIETNLCPNYFATKAGNLNSKIINKTLKLIQPNGGEKFVIGSDSIIIWEGIAPIEICDLEISKDNGANWLQLGTNGTNLKYLWKSIKKPTSDSCLIKIKQNSSIHSNSKKKLILNGHSDIINCLAINPNGNLVVTGSNDNIAKVWDINSGLILSNLIGHSNQINVVAFSNFGTKIITGSKDNTIKIWDVNSGSLIQTLSGHSSGIIDLIVSMDDSKIISCSYDGTIKIWDAFSGALIMTLVGHSGAIYDLDISPDGNTIISGSGDNTIKIWDLKSGNLLNTLNGHSKSINVISVTPDGTKIISGSNDNTIKIWDLKSGKILNTLNTHIGFVECLAISPDANTIISGSRDNTAIIWDLNSGKLIKSLIDHTSSVNSVVISPDASKIITGSSDNSAKIWDINTGKLLGTLIGHSNPIFKLKLTPDGKKIITCSSDKTAIIWSFDSDFIQEDQSDAVFSIVAPEVQSKDIDMKKCLVASSKDSVISNFIENIGSYKCRIDSIYFRGADASAFSLVSGFPQYTIDASQKHNVEIRFKPTKVGIHNAEIVIITQADTLNQKITGEGVQPSLAIINKYIDFGKVYVGDKKDTLQAMTIKNIGISPINISDVKFLSPNDKDFSMISGSKSFTLGIGDTAKMNLRFSANSVGHQSGFISFEYNNGASSSQVQLYAEGIDHGPKIQSEIFGTTDLKCEDSKLDSIKILNQGDMDLKLDNANFSGANSDEFVLLDNIAGITIPSNKEYFLKYLFKPKSDGNKIAELNIKSNSLDDKDLYLQLEANSIRTYQLFTNAKVILKGKIGEISTDTIIFLNDYDFDITITDTSKIDPFYFENLKLPFVIKSKESKEIAVKYKAIDKNKIEKIVDFTSEPCKVKSNISLNYGSSSPKAQLFTGTYQAYPGDTINIPIMLKDAEDLESSNSKNLTVELKFNATLLEPIGDTPIGSLSEDKKLRIIPLQFSKKDYPNNLIVTLKFKVGLGNDSSTSLLLTDPRSDSNDVELTANPGKFHLLGICRAAGPRLINPNGEVKLSLIRPNPVGDNGELDIETIENGQTELYIINLKGEKVATLYQGELAAGKQTLIISTKELSNGTYFVILQTPTVTQKVKMEVVK